MKNVGQCGAAVHFLPIALNLETTVYKKIYFYNNKLIQISFINLLETFMIKCFLDTTPSEKGPLINIKNSVFLIILTKIAIPSTKYCYHILLDMIHQIDPWKIGLELLREIYLSESDWQMRHITLHECRKKNHEIEWPFGVQLWSVLYPKPCYNEPWGSGVLRKLMSLKISNFRE